ncbi:MAG: hypothetical protein SFY80_07680 [Verrucomicrobiota bacterium]|nr:hypothetical protein [Verrucomicrobiota bacterium]
MAIERPILLVGGAPSVPVYAVRHLTVAATGTTAHIIRVLMRYINPDILKSWELR